MYMMHCECWAPILSNFRIPAVFLLYFGTVMPSNFTADGLDIIPLYVVRELSSRL